MNVTRAQVLAYRSAMHGLTGAAPHDALLGLGVQDSPVGSAAQALSARGLADDELVTVWSFRGAPHRHRPGDLRALSDGLWPLSDADARARLAALGPVLKKAGRDAVEAIRETASAVADVVARGTTKGGLSAGVTERVDAAYASYCRGCAATHVNDQLLRLSALHGGARIDTATPLTFAPIARWRGVPTAPKGTGALLRAYLTVLGPAMPADAAGFLGSAGPHVREVWPDGLAEVRVDGAKAWLPEESLSSLADAEPVRYVRLLPPWDPYLQARDRALFVPDAAHRKVLWPVLAWPGALVVDGEVAGTWRAKQAGKGRLAVTVAPFGKLPPKRRPAVEAEAARVAGVRGMAAYDLTLTT